MNPIEQKFQELTSQLIRDIPAQGGLAKSSTTTGCDAMQKQYSSSMNFGTAPDPTAPGYLNNFLDTQKFKDLFNSF